jgi:hypothetical protein
MGKQLESLNRGLEIKIPIQITEGNKRPEPPIQATKFASEGGITLRCTFQYFTTGRSTRRERMNLQ